MKRITLIIGVLLFLYSCADQASSTYTLTGKLPIDGYDGRDIYLCRLDDELTKYINIDSSFIKGDTFSFSGIATDSLVARYIFIGKKGENRINHPKLLFIPEEGNIQMDLDKSFEPTVSGTPKNDEFQKIQSVIMPLRKKSSDNVDAFLKAYVENDKMNFDLLGDSNTPKEVNDAVFNYLMSIKHTPLFDDIYSNLQHYINDDQKSTTLGWTGSRYKNKIDKYSQSIRNRKNAQ